MSTRSTKQSWLEGGDLREETVEDVPVKGQSIKVRALPALVSARVQSQMRVQTEGREQIARIDVAEMEILQFAHGVVDPQFSEDEARQIAEQFGPAFRKVIAKIDELSGVDKEAIEQTDLRFPDRGNGQGGSGRGELQSELADPKGVGG